MAVGDTGQKLARQVREHFAQSIAQAVPEISGAVAAALEEALRSGFRDLPVPMQVALEAPRAFGRAQQQWEQAARNHWLLIARGSAGDSAYGAATSSGDLQLVDDIVVEGKILAARLGASVNETNTGVWADLQIRMQRLEYSRRLASDDPLRAEVFVRCLLVAWRECGLLQPLWMLVQDKVKVVLAEVFASAYEEANQTLVDAGIPAQLDLKSRVRRAVDPGPRSTLSQNTEAALYGLSSRGGLSGQQVPSRLPNAYRAAPLWAVSAMPTAAVPSMAVPQEGYGRLALAWALRQRSPEVLDQLQGLLTQWVPGFGGAGGEAAEPSPALARALSGEASDFRPTVVMSAADLAALEAAPVADAAPVRVQEIDILAHQLRQRATELKSRAEKPTERAVIEVVALMFQAILAEETIAAGIKVWFARLQVPVLRLALSDTDFFAAADHPARQLIDRMGGCAMGLDAAAVPVQQLEEEIRRIVQVIEQYPDTGRRVFEAMLRDFEKFLERWLTDSESLQQATSLAQRVEQREALVVQYSIELARLLKKLPVSELVRQFLFNVWSDVLAVATVRGGAHHEETLRFKQAAGDLIRATSVQPDRQRRQQMLRQLADLLALLRQGMASVALDEAEQETYIRQLKDAVMEAFEGHGEALATVDLVQFTEALEALEDVVTDDPEGDMMLDPGAIELMFGEESAATITVIASGGEPPHSQLLSAVRQLQRGDWFTLRLDGDVMRVQYVWRSQRGQLHLFATGGQKTYLVQTQRLAGYFQAGLMTPVATETLTTYAAREALTMLQENPEELLL